VLTFDELGLRREVITGAPDLTTLLERLLARAREVIRRRPVLPAIKGMLTADGGVCSEDGAALTFDPWSPSVHRCGRCGREYRGERHDWRWAWHQHLWYAERIAEAAIAGLLAEDEELTEWSRQQLLAYVDRYFELPNRDNVLGPTRLFSSTYLESVWLTNYLTAGFVLREAGLLDEAAESAVGQVVEESANLIGEFDEGLSNRQTWHNAALAAASVWFGDEELAARAITGPRGLVGHLIDGFRGDGLWYEGENYHLFALRGLLIGAGWARQAGMDFFADEASRNRIALALQAPALTALPTGEFPARKDSRFGVSLAQPMYLEMWEAGIAGLSSGGDDPDANALGSWLHTLYAMPAPPAQTFDSWLHDAGERAPTARSRSALSWWMLCTMLPMLPGDADAWRPGSVLLPEQGLAILRTSEHYVSLECGLYGGGHGHPDRLHLTLHADGVHWLADPGTGTYVARDLFWYRSTLAHNAPRLDRRSQPEVDARAEMFEDKGRWAWVRGSFDQCTRTTVAGPGQLVDIVEFAGEEEHTLDLAWHPAGRLGVATEGRWEAGDLGEEFVRDAERFIPARPETIRFRARLEDRDLDIVFDGPGEIWRGMAPGRPGDTELRPFLLRRAHGRYVRMATALRWAGPEIAAVRFTPSEIRIETSSGAVVHHQTSEGWEVEDGEGRVTLKGLRRVVPVLQIPAALVGLDDRRFTPPVAAAPHALTPPALDGSLTGFSGPSLLLDHDDQYRRSEEPYPGAEEFSAEARIMWDERALFVAVDVVHPEPMFRATNAPALRLDNEPDLIQADGVQLQLGLPDGRRFAWVVSPDPAGAALQVHAVTATEARESQVKGAWRRTAAGYTVTFAIELTGWPPARTDGNLDLDLQVNEMRPGRLRRAGQLVWTGGGGWVYLRGDRGNPDRMGILELA
jgi:heparinase II/III-like protein